MDRGEGRVDSLLTHSAPEQYEEQSEGVEDVVGRHPEHELEIEGVELRDEEEDRDAEDRHPPLEARQRVPRELDPAVRRKLTEETLDLSPESGSLIEGPPVVRLHTQIPEINSNIKSD